MATHEDHKGMLWSAVRRAKSSRELKKKEQAEKRQA